MNYTEFINAVKEEVKEHLEPDIIVELHTAMKNNGTIRKGLMIGRRGVNVSPAIYLEEFYEQYLKGKSISLLVETIQQIYEQVKVQNSYSCDNIFSYEKVKEKIVYKLIQREANENLLGEVPYEEFLDLALVFYVLLEATPFGNATLLVKNEHLGEWGVSKEEIMKAAEKNTPKLLPLRFEKLANFMYVMTNQPQNLGACTVCYPEACKKARETIGENFYVIPSSIHEMILIPESYGLNRLQLEIMAGEINSEDVEEEEVLSGNVYYYSGKEGRLIL